MSEKSEIILEERELERERLRARQELDSHLVSRLDAAFRTRPGSSNPFDADEAYFAKFRSRLRSNTERRQRDLAHQDLPGSVRRWFERTLPGTIPGGATLYFQEFAERLWARIRSSSAPEEVPEWLERALKDLVASAETTELSDEFFDTFLDRVLERIDTGDTMSLWLGKALSAKQWEMPVEEQAYFDGFSRRLKTRTHPNEEEELVPEWLSERLSAATFGASSMEDRPTVIGRIGESRRARKPRVHVLHSPVTQWAIAACICLLLGLGVMLNYQRPVEYSLQPTSYSEALMLQQSLGGGSLFVDPVSDGDESFLMDGLAAEVRLLSGELNSASDAELEFIIKNINTN